MKWKTELRNTSTLKNWKDNPRVISQENFSQLESSVQSLGNFEPLVIDIDGTVIAGNQRLRIHLENGDKEVEVSVPERKLTSDEIKKVGIISNRHSGSWDYDKLGEEFEDILNSLGIDDLVANIEYNEGGGEEELEKFLSQQKGKYLLKIETTSDTAEKIMKVIKDVAKQKDITDEGLVLWELIKKHEVLY